MIRVRKIKPIWLLVHYIHTYLLVCSLNQTVNDGVAHSKNAKKCAYHVTVDLDLDLENTLDAR